MKPFALVLLLLFAPVALPAAPLDEADLPKIVQHLDQLFRSSSSQAEVEMTIQTPNWERTLTMTLWSEGMNKTFIRIHSPKKDQGVATLRIGQEMWNYFPKVDKLMKVPPSMMMGSWMGSDFTNDDLVRESSYLDDYEVRYSAAQPADPNLLAIDLIPKETTASVWGRIKILLAKSGWMPQSETFYDEKGNPQRRMTLANLTRFGQRLVPAVMEILPLTKAGHKTTIRYHSAQFDVSLPSETFNLKNLQRR